MADKDEASSMRAASRRGWRQALEASNAWQALAAATPVQLSGDTITADATGREAQRLGTCAFDVLNGQGYAVRYTTNPLTITIQEEAGHG